MKKWLINHFLPLWAKETVLLDNRQLQQENLALQHKLDELEAYVCGLHKGLRAGKRMPADKGGQR